MHLCFTCGKNKLGILVGFRGAFYCSDACKKIGQKAVDNLSAEAIKKNDCLNDDQKETLAMFDEAISALETKETSEEKALRIFHELRKAWVGEEGTLWQGDYKSDNSIASFKLYMLHEAHQQMSDGKLTKEEFAMVMDETVCW